MRTPNPPRSPALVWQHSSGGTTSRSTCWRRAPRSAPARARSASCGSRSWPSGAKAPPLRLPPPTPRQQLRALLPPGLPLDCLAPHPPLGVPTGAWRAGSASHRLQPSPKVGFRCLHVCKCHFPIPFECCPYTRTRTLVGANIRTLGHTDTTRIIAHSACTSARSHPVLLTVYTPWTMHRAPYPPLRWLWCCRHHGKCAG